MVNYHFKNLTDNYRKHSMRRFEKHVFPWFGSKDIRDIKAKDVINRLHSIEEQNLGDTVKKVRILINLTFKYAILTDRCEHNPCESLKGFIKPPKAKHMPSFTNEEQVAGLMRSIDCFTGSVIVGAALKLAPLVFVRPGELRTAQWADINFDACEWRFTVSKTNTEHLVSLSTQAMQILSELKKFTGNLKYVFPNGNDKNKPMSEAAINASLRRLGYDTKTEFTGHGFRAMARTLLHEKLDYDPHIIEHQLAHAVPDSLGQAYNRTKFIDKRKVMMQEWSDYLYKLKDH
jgi:integrase